MRSVSAVVVAFLIALAGVARLSVAAPSKAEAQAAANAWLPLVDNEQYAESWAESSAMFRSRVAQQQWVELVKKLESLWGR